ncbi:MAG: MT-A70 family methyltransferase [Nanoarchaeota archaeon]
MKESGKYQIIYADPPWNYFKGGYKNQSQHYDGMSIDEICNLPIKDLAADDCILFLWVTFPVLKDCFRVIESWGFEYSTIGFNWIKANKNKKGFFFGLGNWTRSNSEICLIATKGSIKRLDASISQIIYTPIEGHSKKPDEVKEKIVKLVGDLPRIELFARQKTDGWDVWGNEI